MFSLVAKRIYLLLDAFSVSLSLIVLHQLSTVLTALIATLSDPRHWSGSNKMPYKITSHISHFALTSKVVVYSLHFDHLFKHNYDLIMHAIYSHSIIAFLNKA